jgi:gamma-glutamyltranspeptidase/glutathione hydrolase
MCLVVASHLGEDAHEHRGATITRRRTLLAAVPDAALLPGSFVAEAQQAGEGVAGGQGAPEPGQGGAPQLAAPALPKRWEAGTDRFLRPDVTAGDRPVGASFASRTAAYGLNGAAQRRSNPIGCAILNTGAVTTSAALMINSRDRSNSHRG